MASSNSPPSPTTRSQLRPADVSLDSTLLNANHSPENAYSNAKAELHPMDLEAHFELRGDHKCCGVVEEAKATAMDNRERRLEARGAQPWIVAKLMVAVTFGIMGYAGYVYLGILVVPMIKMKKGAGASRSVGITLLVFFSILYLWMIWAYIKVILTAPGYARDYIQKSPLPLLPPPPPLALPISGYEPAHITGGDVETEMSSAKGRHSPAKERSRIGGPSYEDMTNAMIPAGMERSISTITIKSKGSGKSGSRSYRFNAGEMMNPAVRKEVEDLGGNTEGQDTSRGEADASDRPLHVASDVDTDFPADLQKGKATRRSSKPILPLFSKGTEKHSGLDSGFDGKRRSKRRSKPRTYITRRPPMTPVLLPAHRYCARDEIVKPYRTHHCRSCGTCVLKYDHHCPWIGQCVGARNHKFFLNFCQATFVFAIYVFGTLLGYTIKSFNRVDLDINPQQIVVIALAGLFALFSSSLFVSHTLMICQGQTTVESMQIRTMKERENDQLAKAFHCWEFGAKQQTLKEWDEEWGNLNMEGNIWWIGGWRREWEDVMGKNRLGWILPIGRSLNDGLTYPVNSRFDKEGKWRRRSEWLEDAAS